jgi:uncharacterized membrane protein HdeD (DUF308 family)
LLPLGVVLVGLGVWMLADRVESVSGLAVVIGMSLIASGIAEAGLSGGRQRTLWGVWGDAVLVLMAGCVVITWADSSLFALTLIGGVTLMLGGVVQGAAALVRQGKPGWALELGFGATSLVVATAVLSWPDATPKMLAAVFGARAVAIGVLSIAAGWHRRNQAA